MSERVATSPTSFKEARAGEAARSSRPNVVVVLLDDVGFAQFRQVGFRRSKIDPIGVGVELLAGDEVVGHGATNRPMPVGMMQVGGTGLCIGYDRGFPVTEQYTPPFEFNGDIRYVEIEVPDGPDDIPSRIAQALHED